MTFEMIFGMSIVNAYLIYKENYDTSRMTMLQFRESLVRSLLLGVPFENLKSGPRERSASRMKHKLTGHELTEIEESDRDAEDAVLAATRKLDNNN